MIRTAHPLPRTSHPRPPSPRRGGGRLRPPPRQRPLPTPGRGRGGEVHSLRLPPSAFRPFASLLLALLLALPTPTAPAGAQGISEPGLFFRTLPNGMLAVVREQPSSRLVAINVGIRGGSRNEDPATLGAAHFMEHMYFQGTPARPNLGDLDFAIEALGGSNNAWTSSESINFQILVPARGFDVGLEIMADMLVNSTFPADRFEKERRVVLEELNQSLNDPVDYLFETFEKQLFAGHPAENLPIGSRETINRITRDTIVQFRDTYFVAGNMVVVVVGNVRHEEVFPRLEAAFANLRQAPRPAFKSAPPPEPRARRIEVPYDSEQAHLAIGLPLPAGFAHDDRYALQVANAMLAGVGQRLFNVIVDQEGLASEVASGYWQYTDLGVWVARASTAPEDVDAVVELIGAELQRLRDEPLTEAELADARSSLAGGKELAQESVGLQAEELSDGIALGYYTSVPEYVARIEAVTAADVQRVARRYLDPEQALVVVLRPE